MGKFSNGFWGRLGRNTADLGSNVLFGDKWSRPVKHIRGGGNVRNESYDDTRSKIERANYLNSVDSAVNDNIDIVVNEEYSDSQKQVVRQIQDLLVHVKVNSFMAFNAEDKIRAKYSIAVLSKIQQGIQILENEDPTNLQLDNLTWQYLNAKWRRFLSIRIGTKSEEARNVIICFLLMFFWVPIYGIYKLLVELGAHDVQSGILIILLMVCAYFALKYILLGLFFWLHKNKRKNIASRLAIVQPHEEVKVNEKKNNVESITSTDKRENDIALTSVQVQQMTELYEKYKDSSLILKRGFSFCTNDKQKDILIVGYNPQETSKKSKIYSYDIPKSRYGYWSGVNRLISGMGKDNSEITAYIDLFSYREIDQEKGIKEIVANPKLIGYVVEQIIATQSVIEDIIKPKLIFIKNQAAWAFFGKLKEFTWMGYNLSPIGNINGFEICEIVGFTNAKDRMAQDFRATTNLIGTKVIFANEIDLNKYPTPQELLELL